MQTITADTLKLGFCGMGWIGKSRMNAILEHDLAREITIADPNPDVANTLSGELPEIQCYDSLDEILQSDVDGIVIASPSALHAEQCLKALEHGKAVFCQKPLGRNLEETLEVVKTAERRNLLLHVDFSYRITKGLQQIKQIIRSGELGAIYGINLVFHNAYGPDKTWYKNPQLSGGGCLMDLGIHLIDLLYWIFDNPNLKHHQSHIFHQGKADFDQTAQVEDYAVAQCVMNNQTSVQLSCSWFLPAGTDCIIEATFYGENGGLAFKNINGSFYDFQATRFYGTNSEILTSPPDKWEGKAAVNWAEELLRGNKFDREAYKYVSVARELESFYEARVI